MNALALVLAVALPTLPANHVADQAQILDAAQESIAASAIANAPAPLAVLTVASLEGQAPEELAREARDGWNVSAVLLVSVAEHRIYIQPMQEWSQALSQSAAQRIAAQMAVGMREHPGEAVVRGLELMSVAMQKTGKGAAGDRDWIWIVVIILVVAILIVVLAPAGSGGGGGSTFFFDSGSSSGGGDFGGGGGGDGGGGGGW